MEFCQSASSIFLMEKNAAPTWDSARFRLIGCFPIIIFIAKLIQYIQVGTPEWIVASCHISNLMLGIGMILRAPMLTRVATVWLIIGFPMWLIDAVVTWEMWWSSIYSHLGGFLIGLYAINRVRATGRSWLPALVWFVFLQMLTRYMTAPELNINVAHSPYPLVSEWFTSYWWFWPVCFLVVTAMVCLVEFGLVKLFPPYKLDPVYQTDQAPNAMRLVSEESL